MCPPATPIVELPRGEIRHEGDSSCQLPRKAQPGRWARRLPATFSSSARGRSPETVTTMSPVMPHRWGRTGASTATWPSSGARPANSRRTGWASRGRPSAPSGSSHCWEPVGRRVTVNWPAPLGPRMATTAWAGGEAVLDARAVVVPGGPAGHGGRRDAVVAGPGQGGDEVADGAERVGLGDALVGPTGRHPGGDEGVRAGRRSAGAGRHDFHVAAGGGVVGHVASARGPPEAAVAGQGQSPGTAAGGVAVGKRTPHAVVGGGELGRGGNGRGSRTGRAGGAVGGADLAVAVVTGADHRHRAGHGHHEGHGRRRGPQGPAGPTAPPGGPAGASFVEADGRGVGGRGRVGRSDVARGRLVKFPNTGVARGRLVKLPNIGGGPGRAGHGGLSLRGPAVAEAGPQD